MTYLDQARSWQDRAVDEIIRLVACESPSRDIAALEDSAALLAALGTELLGKPPEILRHEEVPHLVWRLGDGPRRVLLLGHHDTVWPLGTLERIPASVIDGVMRGPGCFDMKVGVVQALVACRLIADRHGLDALDGITVLVTGDEELGAPSSRSLVEREAADCDAAFVLEAAGPRGALKTGRKGVSLYEAQVSGTASHAGLEPEIGVNAGIELALLIPRIAALGRPALGTSVTPTLGSIGTTTNTVPAAASVWVDVRATTVDEQHRVDRHIRELAPQLPGAGIQILGGVNRLPLEERMSAGLFSAAESVAQALGLEPLEAISVGGASDGNFTAAIGVPTLDGLGAVGGGAHAEDEHAIVSRIPERTALLAGLVESTLRS